MYELYELKGRLEARLETVGGEHKKTIQEVIEVIKSIEEQDNGLQ